MSEPHHPSRRPHSGGRHANPARPGQDEFPIARPCAPPPANSPYYRPLPVPEPAVIPPDPLPSAPQLIRAAPGWLEPVALFLVVFVCMTGGWFFFRGPGRSVFGGSAPVKPSATTLADASRPQTTDDSKTVTAPSATPVTPPTPPPPPPVSPPPPSPPPRPVVNNNVPTFASHVRPIFQAKCFLCHNGGKKRGGLDATTVAALLKGGESGPSIKPGDPSNSLLWETIATNKMPPSGKKLTDAERKLVQQWIAGGAK